MNVHGSMVPLLVVGAMVFNGAAAMAAPIPLELPRPDGKPGNSQKPVKVYILAGQSNMVGMGDRTGAKPPYARVFLSADPAIIPGATPIGRNYYGKTMDWLAVERHGMFDAQAAVYADGDVVKPPLRKVPVALGTVAENLPAIGGGQILVVTAQIDVPATGQYFIHAGFGESSHAVVAMDGKEVYRKDIGGEPVLTKVSLEQGKRYPVRIAYLKGGSAAFWLERVDIPGNGDLETVTKRDKKFAYLLDEAGAWTVRNDVYFQEARIAPQGKGSPLSATSNGNSIGPEVGFGFVMGAFHDEQVLLIKTAMGNRALGFDFRPPSSGRTQPSNQWESLEYKLMVEGVRKTLDNIAKIVPGYQGQGFEMAGFFWFQGHKDSGSTREDYEKNLVNLINDLRREFGAPKMPAVVATVGFHGYRLASGPWQGVWEAQMAVGDPKRHPGFAGTVASVDTRDFWREVEESPRSQDYHYNRNAETYLLVGEAAGRAMVRLLGGEAEAIPKSDREARAAAAVAAEAARPEPTAEQKAAHTVAITPMILDGLLAAFLDNPKNQPLLQAAATGQKPAKPTPLLKDTIDEAVEYYQAAGLRDYDWRLFGGDLKNSAWDCFGFDLPVRPRQVSVLASSEPGGESDSDDDAKPEPKAKGKDKAAPSLTIPWPAGMENWFAPDFDARKAGWKTGAAPFGKSAEKLAVPDWAQARVATRAPKTPSDHDVLLLRQTVELPPLKDGCRYRIRIEGSANNNSGEGFAIYANGKLLAESRSGILAWRREGHLPRGVHIGPEFRDLFRGGKVTLAVGNFPMDNWDPNRYVPPGAALSVWIEEQKIPPLTQ